MTDLNIFIKSQLRRNPVFITHGASITQLIAALHATAPTSKKLCALAEMEAAIETLHESGEIKLEGTTRYVINDAVDLPNLSDLSPHAQCGLRRLSAHHGVDMLPLLNQLLISHDRTIANTYDCPGDYYDGKVSNGNPAKKIPNAVALGNVVPHPHAPRIKDQAERAQGKELRRMAKVQA